jgi:heat shock protein HslJ
VQGFDGCANFSATYQSFEDQLSFSGLPSGAGVSNCLPDAQAVSSAFLTALSQITNFSISGNTLSMRDASGAQRLQFNK